MLARNLSRRDSRDRAWEGPFRRQQGCSRFSCGRRDGWSNECLPLRCRARQESSAVIGGCGGPHPLRRIDVSAESENRKATAVEVFFDAEFRPPQRALRYCPRPPSTRQLARALHIASLLGGLE